MTFETGARNRFDRQEWAGAFGDLGTLIPFLFAYLSVLDLDPTAVLFALGTSMVVCGLVYRTPFPVQPMKAIGAVATTQAVQTFSVTAGAVYASSLVTGLFWLVLGSTGAAAWLVRLVKRPVVSGIVLGMGFAFMLKGLDMMATNGWLAWPVLAASFVFLGNRRFPAMFLMLLVGAAYALVSDPALASQLGKLSLELRLPRLSLTDISMSDLAIGAVLLALPQVPLTLGNAVIAVTDENNRLFPKRPVTVRRVTTSTGLMNLWSGCLGGIPMCHGAGGMAAHVRFGARTGGAPIILGVLLIVVGLTRGPSVQTLLGLFPPAVLGVILFLTGAQLALGGSDFGATRAERFVTLVTAAIATWNVAAGFVAGSLLLWASARGSARL